MAYEPGPLFLPEGSIRAIIVLAILLPLPFFIFHGIIIDEYYKFLATSLIGYLFGKFIDGNDEKGKKERQELQEQLSKLQVQNEIQKLSLAQQQHNPIIVPQQDNR